MESRLGFFPGEVSERPAPKKRVLLVGMENESKVILTVRIQEVLMGDEGLIRGTRVQELIG